MSGVKQEIEAGKTVFKYSDFSIVDFIQELDTIFHSQIYEKQKTFTITKENIRHEWVNGDRVHLMQIKIQFLMRLPVQKIP